MITKIRIRNGIKYIKLLVLSVMYANTYCKTKHIKKKVNINLTN